PPPYYYFDQLPLVRGLAAFWLDKMEGDGTMPAGEPIQDAHMPNTSFLPFIMSLAFFVAGLGFIYHTDNTMNNVALDGGMVFAIGTMIGRSRKDDHGYYIPKEELQMVLDGREAN